MVQAQVFEGTPEQLVKHLNRLPNTYKYIMTVTPDEANTIAPNEQALSMLRDIARMKENMKETDGTETDRLLREARAGAMFGAHTIE
jgi:hypothetical protein